MLECTCIRREVFWHSSRLSLFFSVEFCSDLSMCASLRSPSMSYADSYLLSQTKVSTACMVGMLISEVLNLKPSCTITQGGNNVSMQFFYTSCILYLQRLKFSNLRELFFPLSCTWTDFFWNYNCQKPLYAPDVKYNYSSSSLFLQMHRNKIKPGHNHDDYDYDNNIIVLSSKSHNKKS